MNTVPTKAKLNDLMNYQQDRGSVSLCTLWILMLLFTNVSPVVAQQNLPDRGYVEQSLLPVAGYTSDSGLFGGAMWQRNEYGIRTQLYENRQLIQLLASTRGELGLQIEHERMATELRPTRFRTVLDLERVPHQPYFGIGNQTAFSSTSYESGYYDYLHRSIEWTGEWRRNFVTYESGAGEARLGGTALLQAGWYRPGSSGDQTLFDQHYPGERQAEWVQLVGSGVVVEARDHEVSPTRGYRLQGDLSISAPWLLSDASFRRARVDLRHYLPLPMGIVLAQKVAYEGTWGDVPFWLMPTIGHDQALRGYPLNRFRGRASLVHLAELRTWLFDILDGEIRIGGQIFMDTGRVFVAGEGVGELTEDLHQTFGVGGSLTLFHPDLIFRGDLGFSEEMFRIYAGIGYLF